MDDGIGVGLGLDWGGQLWPTTAACSGGRTAHVPPDAIYGENKSMQNAYAALQTHAGPLPHPGARARLPTQRPFTFGTWNTQSLSVTTFLQCKTLGLDALGIAET